MNKKAKETVMIISILIVATLLLIVRYETYNLYTKECTVVTNMCGWYTVEDEDGELWEFDDKDNYYKLGEKVIVTFDNMDNTYLYDDEIKKVERKG